jgi:hypothetical protein
MENRKQFDELFWRHRQLGQMVGALSSDPKAQRRVAREQRKIASEMAQMLMIPHGYLTVPLPEPLRGDITPVIRVEGQPSKQGRVQAEKWMAEIGVPWDGSINALRSEIYKSLKHGYTIPNGHFDGLYIEWTVEIDDTTECWKKTWAAAEEMIKNDPALSIRVIHD